MPMKDLIQKVESGNAIIGILGMGYVGLPLAISFAKRFNVLGFDVNQVLINNLQHGKSYISDVSPEDIDRVLGQSFSPTTDSSKLNDCDFLIICVPTPLTKDKKPDLSYIKRACEIISGFLNKGQFVILESTTYPGTTDEVVVPMLEVSNLKAGTDFGVAFSPERIDPGNKDYTIDKIPKIVGGINEECTKIAALLYASIISEVICVSDARTAEAVKMVENVFRNVNIALVNELALIFEKMGINCWEVIRAASTKPYGYIPFYPGPGVGGHCIPLDPFYLSYQAKKCGIIPRFIEASGEINEFMKVHVINLIRKGLNEEKKGIFGSKILVLGLAYKKNIGDIRESPSKDIIEELVISGAIVTVFDPFVGSINTDVGEFYSELSIKDAFKNIDCAVVMIDHDVFTNMNLAEITSKNRLPLIIDCKNVFNNLNGYKLLGIGRGDINNSNIIHEDLRGFPKT